jgi:hypothetical protein
MVLQENRLVLYFEVFLHFVSVLKVFGEMRKMLNLVRNGWSLNVVFV